MKKTLALVTLILFVSGTPARADDAGFASLVAGSATLDGKKLEQGDAITKEGLVETAAGAKARFLMTDSKAVITLAPGAKLALKKPAADGSQEHELQDGIARAQVDPARKNKFAIRSRAATMGVRGTDFMAVSNALLGESEIVVFTGEVDFQALANAKDHKRITKGHWGGVGGRFGQKIGKLIQLPENVLKAFDQATTLTEN